VRRSKWKRDQIQEKRVGRKDVSMKILSNTECHKKLCKKTESRGNSGEVTKWRTTAVRDRECRKIKLEE
jgi:hypothetical protein